MTPKISPFLCKIVSLAITLSAGFITPFLPLAQLHAAESAGLLREGLEEAAATAAEKGKLKIPVTNVEELERTALTNEAFKAQESRMLGYLSNPERFQHLIETAMESSIALINKPYHDEIDRLVKALETEEDPQIRIQYEVRISAYGELSAATAQLYRARQYQSLISALDIAEIIPFDDYGFSDFLKQTTKIDADLLDGRVRQMRARKAIMAAYKDNPSQITKLADQEHTFITNRYAFLQQRDKKVVDAFTQKLVTAASNSSYTIRNAVFQLRSDITRANASLYQIAALQDRIDLARDYQDIGMQAIDEDIRLSSPVIEDIRSLPLLGQQLISLKKQAIASNFMKKIGQYVLTGGIFVGYALMIPILVVLVAILIPLAAVALFPPLLMFVPPILRLAEQLHHDSVVQKCSQSDPKLRPSDEVCDDHMCGNASNLARSGSRGLNQYQARALHDKGENECRHWNVLKNKPRQTGGISLTK